MKRPLVLLFFVLLHAPLARAVSALPFYEPFPLSYGNNTILGTGSSATVWSIGNTGSSLGARIFDYGTFFTYPGPLQTDTSSCVLEIFGTPGSNRNKGAPFTPQTLSSSNRTVYASFLFAVLEAPTNSRLFAALSSTDTGTTPSVSAGVWLEPSGHLMISKNSNLIPTATNQINVVDFTTHLVVLRYRWNSSSNDDEVALWVDPQGLGSPEGSVPVPATTTIAGADVASLRSFFIVHTTTTNVVADVVLDEIRVATNWAGVTPTISGLPMLLNLPRVTTAQLNGSTLTLRGTNGSPNAAYQLLAATNVDALPYQWSILGTYLFDAAGNFAWTNAVSPDASQQYYRLLVGGEVPPAPIAPFLTTQPTNETVLVGQNATFTVVAAGDLPLVYQWYFNTNVLLAGATNTSLTISNAQFSDAGGYSVVVANGSGSVTSVVATLTVNSVASGPSILDGPHSLVVTQGQTAFFSVTASGNPSPGYQWFFNTNTLLTDATNSSLTISNAQAGDAGAYSVTVANTNGSVASSDAFLTVLIPPAITNQPADQTLVAGQTAVFGVGALGTAPLSYQWYFNTATPLLNETNSTLNTTNAGGYSVVVVNPIGSVTSIVATLTLVPPPTNSGPSGYAMVNGTTTGGDGGPVVTVSDPGTFASEIAMAGPRVVQVQGTLVLTGNAYVGSDKTVIGLGTNAAIVGNVVLFQATNVIIRNLTFSTPFVPGMDGITVALSEHVWIDHCTFHDCADGEVDIVEGSDFVTVSWCKFYYTANTGHNFVNLIGNNQDLDFLDAGKLHVTFHHNWWSTLCIERMPRVRFGRVHVFNNYHDCVGNNYCVRAGYLSEILVENNYYDGINRPYEYFLETTSNGDTAAGLINAAGNATPNCTNVGTFNDSIFSPPYSYSLETPDTAKAVVRFGAGAGTALFP